MVSVIIPTYNEAETIAGALERLRHARGDFEVLVADGESSEDTPARVEAIVAAFPRPLRLIRCQRGRSLQLNHAAQYAQGGVLLFLHADASLSPDAIEALENALDDDFLIGGNFNLSFQGPSRWNALFTWMNRVRRRFGIYYGDSGLFVRREVFHRLGGFKPIPVMDDYEFVRRLERTGRTTCLEPVIGVSDRRWRLQGVLRTLLSWVVVQGLYSAGVRPEVLARWYPPVRTG